VFNIGPTELIVVLVIALIVFGPRRLPEVGRTVGKSLREFRKASQDLRDELNINLDDEDLPATSPAPGEPGYANWGSAKPSGNGASDATDAGGSSQEGTGGGHAS
jgi:sec-independent protein translocase protein TatA